MQFTDVEKWQMKIRLLEKAKESLRKMTPSYHTGVCWALTDAWREIDRDVDSVEGMFAFDCHDELKSYIDKALGDHAYLLSWIREKVGSKVGGRVGLSYNYDEAKLRDTRIAWIEWMIRCYQRKLKKAGAV